MRFYRERFIAYIVAGVAAIALGVIPAAIISQIVQPAVATWISTSGIMILWANFTGTFRDPVRTILGMPVRLVAICLTILGSALIYSSMLHSSIRLGVGGVLCLCFALDAVLSKRESLRRYQASDGAAQVRA
jgi:hypothetical protein